MKKGIRLKNVIFMLILILPTCVWLLLGAVLPEIQDKLSYDLGENRNKAKLADGLEAYYDDRLPFRSLMIDKYNQMTSRWDKHYRDHLEPLLSGLLYGEPKEGSILPGEEAFFTEEETGSKGNRADSDENPAESDGGKDGVETGTSDGSSEAAGHRYVSKERLDPTCTEAGYELWVCEDCGDSRWEELPALGHEDSLVSRIEASYANYGYSVYQCTRCGREKKDDFVSKLVDTSYKPLTIAGEGIVPGRFEWLFYSGNNSLEYYKGTNLLEEETMEGYLKLAARLKELCDQKGKTLLFIVFPNKEQVYPEYMPTLTVETEYKRVQRLRDFFAENSDIPFVYPLDEMRYMDRYYPTYYKFDTHWNEIGAFVGTQAMYRALGMETTNLSELEVTSAVNERWNDDFAMGGLDPSVYTPDLEYTVTYKPDVNLSEELLYAKDIPFVYRTQSDSTNGQKLVFLGDSFRVAMVKYISRDFEKCTIAHRDYLGAVEKDVREADVLVVSAVERYDSRIFPTVEKIIEILEGE